MVALASPTLAQQGRNFGFRIQFGTDVERLLRQAENHTAQFAALVDEREHYGLAERAHELERQLNMVGGDFEQRSSFYDRASNGYDRRSQVANALRVAQSINNAMRYRRVDFDVQREWSTVRFDLNRLARAYNLRQIG
ncbi:MAG: hypothetical protein DMF60_05930 [Acidobacteria bacterium]|nr:MAG: hypothetical protein DMF60_05930 [Acidobacteriota bacterium]